MYRPIALILCGFTGACTLGPNYDGPPVTPGTNAMHFSHVDASIREDVPTLANWWTSLGDETLDTLISNALAANPGIEAIRARVRQARASLRLERSNQSPSVGVRVAAAHAELPDLAFPVAGAQPGSFGPPDEGRAQLESVDLFSAGFDARWEVDLFGGQRRAVEAALALMGMAEADLADAQVQLTAEVTRTYNNFRVRQKLLVLARQTATLDQRMLDLVRQRRDSGVASSLEVERFQIQLDTAEAQIPPIQSELDQLQNALTMLAGKPPGAFDGLLDGPGRPLLVPAVVSVGDPASLVRRRPDIRAAERQLAARTARIGVAEASRFPRLSLFGLIGLGSNSFDSFVDSADLSALAMPQLQWQFLDFGRGAARVEQAKGSRTEAEIRYRETVLDALRDAEDALSRFGFRRRSTYSVARATAAAIRSSALEQERYQAGTVTKIDALAAERERVAAERNLILESGALVGDFVSLQKALGLGWSTP